MNQAPQVADSAQRLEDTHAIQVDLQQYGQLVDHKLRGFFARQAESIPSTFPQARHMLDIAAEFCLRGGKRLRPYLTRCGYQLFGGQDESLAFRASLIPELIHAFLLIHDDIMDQNNERRGGPTVHAVYTQELGDSHLGNSMGILAGDFAYTLALQMLADLSVSDEMRTRLLRTILEAVTHTVHGQDIDLRAEHTKADIPETLIARHKTAYYSFKMPLEIGALLAGANNDQVETLSGYAFPCGIAFQLTDDNLDGKAESRDRIQSTQYVTEAKDALADIPGAEAVKTVLADLADYIGRRKL